jgi:NO-binding membrane sensor protein with MHYT domain
VIDPVAAVGLWLAAAWGGVVWLTATISMAAIEMLFPQVYGGSVLVILAEVAMLGTYFALAVAAARERPE